MDSQVTHYQEVYARWQRDPEGFWGEAAQEIDWIEPAKRVFDPDAGVYGRWFVGGVCNTCWNAVDRHVRQGRGEQPAIIYDSPLTGQKRKKALVFGLHEGSSRSELEISPGLHEVRVEVRWDENVRTERIVGSFRAGATRRLEVNLGRIRRDLELEWN